MGDRGRCGEICGDELTVIVESLNARLQRSICCEGEAAFRTPRRHGCPCDWLAIAMVEHVEEGEEARATTTAAACAATTAATKAMGVLHRAICTISCLAQDDPAGLVHIRGRRDPVRPGRQDFGEGPAHTHAARPEELCQ